MMLQVLLADVVGLIFSILATDWAIKTSKERGLTGKDVNKPDKPQVPVLGGIGIVAGFVAGSMTLQALFPSYSGIIEPVTESSLLIGLLGVLDDFLNIKQGTRAFLPVFAAVPLSIASLGHSIISIPLVGEVNFGILFYVLVIPASLTITSNAFNMLEGLNGLGAGMAMIMAFTLFLIGAEKSGPTGVASYLSLILFFSVLGFFLFNKYPAKTFPGNVGTYFLGAVIGSIGISGYMFTALAVLFIPYVIEFILKAKTKFKGISFGELNQDGYLTWNKYPQSLTHVVMKMGKFREYHVVYILWIIEALFAALAYYLQTTTIVLI